MLTIHFYSEEQLKLVEDGGNKKEDSRDLEGQEELTLSSLSLDMTNSKGDVVDHDQIQTAYIPSYYIQVIEEPMEYDDGKELARKATDIADNSGGGSSEAYEKTTAKHGDKAFYKFHKKLSRCPEQVLRYVKWYRFNLLAFTCLSPFPLCLLVRFLFVQVSMEWHSTTDH